MSDTDRTRYEKLKRLLKEGITEDMSCTCPPEEQPQVPGQFDKTDSDVVMTTSYTGGQKLETHITSQVH